MNIAYLNNDNAIEVTDLYDPRAASGVGEYITTASSATAQVYEMDRTTTVGGSITLTYSALKANVEGHWWYGVLEEDHAAITSENTQYSCKVNITASSDRVFEDWVDFVVRRRR